jgi:hypothetical protein
MFWNRERPGQHDLRQHQRGGAAAFGFETYAAVLGAMAPLLVLVTLVFKASPAAEGRVG